MLTERIRAACLGAVALITLGLAPAAQAMSCARPAEVIAMQTRILQSELMVAALTCDARDSYNRFARKFQSELVVRGRTLRAYFRRAHGARGERELNGFITRLANQASQRSLAQGAHYCRGADALFESVLTLPQDSLVRRVSEPDLAGAPGIIPCYRDTAK